MKSLALTMEFSNFKKKYDKSPTKGMGLWSRTFRQRSWFSTRFSQNVNAVCMPGRSQKKFFFKENCFIQENGDVLALTADSARYADHFPASDTYVDGSGIGDVGNAVLHDRHELSEDGIVLAVATVDFEKKTVLAGPDMLSRGFIYMRESGDLIRSGQRVLFNAIREAMHEENANEASVARAMREALSPFLYKQTERSPLVVPMIMTPDK